MSARRERLGQARRDPPKRSVSTGKAKGQKTPFPADGFSPEMKRQLLAYPKMRELNLNPSQASHAVERVKLWAEGDGRVKVDWVKVTANAILAGWGLDGHSSQGNGRARGVSAPRLPMAKSQEEMLADDPSLKRLEDLSDEERAENATTGDQIRESLSKAKQARKDTAAHYQRIYGDE